MLILLVVVYRLAANRLSSIRVLSLTLSEMLFRGFNHVIDNNKDGHEVKLRIFIGETGGSIGDAVCFVCQAIQAFESLRNEVEMAIEYPDSDAGAKRWIGEPLSLACF